MAPERDPQLRRIERTALVACAVTVLAAAIAGAGWRGIVGAVGGALLVAVSWYGVRSGVDAVLRAAPHESRSSRRRSAAWRLVKFVTRFAILALLAYVMMVRLRAQSWWVLAGATSVVAAPVIEVFRQLRAQSQS